MADKFLRQTWLVALIISGFTVLMYADSLSFGILHNFDDDAYFADARIQNLSFQNLKACFSGIFLGMYQPLPALSFGLVNHFFPQSATAQHTFNLLLHCINLCLVLLLARRLSGSPVVAAAIALIFALHPMQVESVVWISARSNLMYSAFFLGALLALPDAASERHRFRWMLVGLLFILALFSKVTATTLPAVLLLTAWYRGQRFSMGSLGIYLPLFLLSAVFIYVGIQASGSFGHITDMGQTYALPDRALILLQALWLYLSKFLVPFRQSALYLYPLKEGALLPLSFFVSAGLLIIFIAVVLWAVIRKGRLFRNREGAWTDTGKALLYGILFFGITISIVLPLKWSRTVLIAERYTYLPYLGLSFAGLMLLKAFLQNRGIRAQKIAVGTLAVLIITFAYLTHRRTQVWATPLTLFGDVMEKNIGRAETAMGYYNRGNEYLRLGNTDAALSDYTAAVGQYTDYREALYNRGLVNYLKGDNESAVRDFTSAIGLKDDFTDAYINRAAAYRNTGHFELALYDLNKAIALHPSELAYLSRGILYYSNLGQPEQACSDWNSAASLGSDQARELLSRYCQTGEELK
jgi:protein O-mannosyl-transferase